MTDIAVLPPVAVLGEQAVPISNSSAAGSAVAALAGEIHLVKPDVDTDGGVQFKLSINSSTISSVEVVDLDLMLVTTTGERLLLPQAALQAITSPKTTTIRFSNGSTNLVADEIKKIGLVAPPEGGSYRIQATAIQPVQSTGVKEGSDFGLGKDSQDKASQMLEEMQHTNEQLQQIVQTLQNASMSNAQTDGLGAGLGPGNGPGTGLSANSLASTVPGSTPNINTSTKIEDKNVVKDTATQDPQVNTNINLSLLDAARSLQHATVSKVTSVNLADTSKTFADIKSAGLLPSNPLIVNALPGNEVAPAGVGVGNGTVAMDFLLPGRSAATSFRLALTSGSLPDGFTINGKSLSASGLTFNAASNTQAQRLALHWTTAEDSRTVVPSDFQVSVQFFDAAGNLILNTNGAGAAPITFHYADYLTLAEFNTMGGDSNSNSKFYLSARGLSYDINGTPGDDVINAGDGFDILRGGAGNDTLFGGRGDDILIGGEGADKIDGGTGTNTASYAGSNAGVTVSLVTGVIGSGGHAQGETLTNIQNLIGSDYADNLFGNDAANRLDGGLGDDFLTGGMGGDILIGGQGNDTVSYFNAAARVVTTDGTVKNTGVVASLATPSQNEGDAAGDSYSSIENLRGSEYDDVLTGDSASNRLDGGTGNDTLVGGAGSDALVGGGGTDTASYAAATTGIVASLENSTENSGTDAAGDTYDSIENLTGSIYNDTLTGNTNTNTLDGGAGDDTLVGGAGADILIGGEGSDTASYAGANAVRVNLSDPTNATLGNTGFAIGDTYNSIENLKGSDGSDTLIGDAHSNKLWGGKGADILMGGGGGDSFDGGEDIDTVSYATAISGVNARLAANEQVLNAGAAVGDTYTSIENLTGSDYDDLLIGDVFTNLIQGGKGNDTLMGGAGGNADTLNGGEGNDTVSYVGSTAAVSLNISSGGTGGDANSDQYVDIENAIGTDFSDQIQGSSADNILWGGAGGDILAGGGGNDYLYGGDGDDTLKNTGLGQHYYDGDSGTNTVSYEGFVTALSLNLAAIDGNSNGAGGREYFTNIQNLIGGNKSDSLTGNSQVNTLNGKSGNDTLFGMGGNDVLMGGDGNDFLEGGAGADILNGEAGDEDVASYAQSSTGVVIDMLNTLVGGGRGTGDAMGDTFNEIEIIEGSSRNDYIYAGASATRTIYRGLGDDSNSSITVGGIALNGDTVDFSSYAQALAIDLTQANAVQVSDTVQIASFLGIENLVGTNHDDILKGDVYANKIYGGVGNDTLVASRGANDTLDGGAGINTATYANYSNDSRYALAVNMGSLTGGYYQVQVTDGNSANSVVQTDLLKYIENLQGSVGADSITGDNRANKLEGMGGDDSLMGGDGNDILQGGLGNDKLFGGQDNDILEGDAGDDILEGGAGADTLIGGDGVGTEDTASYASAAVRTLAVNSTVSGVVASLLSNSSNEGDAAGDTYEGVENLLGSAYDDHLSGDDKANKIDGGDGNDTLYGAGGNDILLGGKGDDTLLSSVGADKFIGGDGADVVSYAAINTALSIDLQNDTVGSGVGKGDALGDVIDSTIETVVGGTAADLFFSGGRTSALMINGGIDALANVKNTVSYANATGTLTASLADVTANANSDTANTGAAANDRYVNIQNLIGSAHSDILRGDTNNNVLSGGDGDDSLWASMGVDTLYGGTSASDTGRDTVTFKGITTAVTAELMTGNATFTGGITTMHGIENIVGSSQADSLTGNDADNRIEGGAGNDTLMGGDGNDTLVGGSGFDSLFGGAGTADVVSYSAVTNGITIDLANTSIGTGRGTGDAAGDVIDGSVEIVQGSAANATIFYGRATNESVIGGSADDTFFGSSGGDTLDGAGGTGDKIDYSTSTAAVTVNLQTNVNSGGDAQGDVISNIESVVGTIFGDTLTAQDGVNTTVLEGGDGNDALIGGTGSDFLYAGAGNDTLRGNAGNDTLNLKDTNATTKGTNVTLAGDFADGGAGNDTIIVAQNAITNASFTVDGGADSDTLIFYATTSGSIDLKTAFNPNLGNNFNNFETLDLKTDGMSSRVEISADWVRNLVDKGDSSVLTLRLGAEDSYTVRSNTASDTEYSFGSSSLTFQNSVGHIIATVNFSYV